MTPFSYGKRRSIQPNLSYRKGLPAARIIIIPPLVILVCLVFSFSLYGQLPAQESNWDRISALEVVRNSDTSDNLKHLFQLARAGKNTELLQSLSEIGQDSGLPAPVRDYLAFSFTLGLSDLEPDAVNSGVLDYLSNYRARTLVTHYDHPEMTTPLFNVRAAAAGVRNQWARKHAFIRAENLNPDAPNQWIEAYLNADPAERRGFVDTLDFALPGQLHDLGSSALALLDEHPELTLVATRASLNSGDINLLQQSISRGKGPALSKVLKAAAIELNAEDAIGLLDHCLRYCSDTSAALAIAHLAPAQLHESKIREMLFDTLGNRDLGAAAALVLGGSKDPQIHSRLGEIASNKDSLTTKRAKLAVSSRALQKEVEL